MSRQYSFLISPKRTTDESIAARRNRIEAVRAANKVIYPWLNYLFEQGRTNAHLAITEMDITAQFTDPEDQIIALFASLAAKPGTDSFATCDIFQGTTPHDMVSKRLFTEVSGTQPFSVIRFKRLMDTLWRWSQDYYSVYDAFKTLVYDPDPLSTLIWMFSDDRIPVERPDFRLPRFLMALMLDDQGIGQAILPHSMPENLTVPLCSAVSQLKRTFCPLQNITMGEVANVLGLEQETDLYYLALGWQQLLTQYPKETASLIHHMLTLQKSGGHDRNQRDSIKKLFRIILPEANPPTLIAPNINR